MKYSDVLIQVKFMFVNFKILYNYVFLCNIILIEMFYFISLYSTGISIIEWYLNIIILSFKQVIKYVNVF